ncbi:MAG: multicopper oxidase domain-containing protein [Solirubrobacterales bacterium]
MEGIRAVGRKAIVGLVAGVATLVTVAFPAASAADVVHVRLDARPATVHVAAGVRMRAWTYNGTVPAPVIRVREGDTVEVTLHNSHHAGMGHHGMAHSVDFHAAEIAPNLGFVSVAPGKTHTFSFVAKRPGVYMYHCGTPPMLQHIGRGMYGAIIVEPAEGRPPAREMVLVQSELYGPLDRGILRPSLAAMRTQLPRYVVFNGFAERYARHPIKVPVGKRVRIYLVDAGPTFESAFHVVGEIFDVAQHDGNPDEALHDVSTMAVPPGGGAVFELTFDEAGAYPFVTHAVRWADAGAMGRFLAG